MKTKARPLSTGEIWKRMVRPTVHTNPSRKQNFSKTLFKHEEFENAGFSFRVDGKHLENGASWNRWPQGNHVISLPEIFSSTNPIWAVVVPFLNSCGVVWKNLMRFRSETSIFRFVRSGVDGAWVSIGTKENFNVDTSRHYRGDSCWRHCLHFCSFAYDFARKHFRYKLTPGW